MKLKFILVSLVGLVASGLLATAQSTPTTADNSQPAASAAAATSAPAETTAAPAAPTQTAAQDTNTTAAATNATAAATTQDTNTAAAATTGTVATGTNAAPRDANAVIPLIVMDEVPLTDAIKNLARQAGLNYMLDPKLPYLSPGPEGQKAAQPTVSLRWENLTADQALYAVLNNYNLTVVDDPKTKIARITVKDPAAPPALVTKIIQLKYSDPTNAMVSIQSILQDKRSKVVPDVRTSQLVVVATDPEIAAIDELVARLDTPIRQVLIEAKLVETAKNPKSKRGVDWTATLDTQNFAFGNNLRTPSPTDSINPLVPLSPFPRILADTANGFNPGTAFLDADGVSAALSFLNTEADARVLSTPRAVTLDNTEATLSVTTATPIFKTTAGTQGSPGGAEVQYTNVGTILKVTPRISANDTINLRVIPEVSDFAGTVTKTVAGLVNQADTFDVRHIETRVVIPSGNTLVMGGLLNDNSTKGTTKVPFLGDIPGLGWAFRWQSKNQNKRNLIVFITPTVVLDDHFTPTTSGSDFLHTKAEDKSPITITAWDKGDRQDWSALFGNKKIDDDSTDPKYPEPTSK